MFRAIGTIVVLWYVSVLFSQTFEAADSAFSASFRALEAASVASERQFVK